MTRKLPVPVRSRTPSRVVSRAVAIAGALACVACGSGSTAPAPHVLAAGEIGTWAGTGVQGSNGDGRDRLATWLDQPMEMVFSPEDDTAYVVDWNNHSVRHVRRDGTFETVVGTGEPGDWPCQVPGDATLCDVPLTGTVQADSLLLNHPMDLAFEPAGGSFYVAAWHNHKIVHYDAGTNDVTVVAGLQRPGPAVPPAPPVTTPPTPPGPGDGSPAAKAPLNFPSSVVLQGDGSLLVSDERNNRVRRIAAEDPRTITTVAGAPAATGTSGDGIAATTALLNLTTSETISGADNPPPGGAIALDRDGNLYIADTFHHAIRKVLAGADGIVTGAADELISTVAGTLGAPGYSGDGGAATGARLRLPFDVEIGPDGMLYVADTENHALRRVDLAKDVIETIAGTGKPGFSGDDGPAVKAQLREPYGLAFDGAGDLFVVDTINDRIRRIARARE